MSTHSMLFGFVFLMGAMISRSTHAQVDMGVSIGEEGVRGFYLAIGQYFHRPERDVMVVHERGLPDDEIPVAFFIAARAGVEPRVIIDLRLDGMRWIDICSRHRLSPEIFYVSVPVEVKGPPYGRAYGYYKKKPRKEWKSIVLADDDVVNLVNLRVMSEHYRVPAAEIIRMRSEGKSFVVVNDDVRKGKKDKTRKEKGKGRKK